MSFKIEPMSEALTKLVDGEKVKLRIYEIEDRAASEIYLSTAVNITHYEQAKTDSPPELMLSKIQKLKQNVLDQPLFNEEARKLKHYEELKTMKFALDALEKLVPVARQKLGVDKLTDL